jgi:hypothetical protein
MENQGWLKFTDRRDRGAFPVYDAAGAEVARITTGRAGTRFKAMDSDGALLCEGAAGWLGLSGVWRTTGPARKPLLIVRKSPLRPRAVATLAHGADVVIRGSVWKRDFQVMGTTGAVLLTASPSAPSLSLQPHEYVIHQPKEVLTLAEVVALVASWRLIRKSENAAVAGAGVTAAITSSG